MNWLAIGMMFLVGGCAGCQKKTAAPPSETSKPAVPVSPSAPEPARRIRHAQIAGSWYPDNKDQLAAEVDALLAQADRSKLKTEEVEAFWDSLASQSSSEISRADAISYEQARQLGLAPEE